LSAEDFFAERGKNNGRDLSDFEITQNKTHQGSNHERYGMNLVQQDWL
jgi:hypothetical protein